MRLLAGPVPLDAAAEVSDHDLRAIYEAPRADWLRVNMISTVDGAATGTNGKSGSINNAADKRVFDLLRDLADAIVVGAGTARVEGYRPEAIVTVVVSRSGEVPERLRGGTPGQVVMATCSSSGDKLDEARDLLGAEHVLVLGSHRVDLARMREELAARGFRRLLAEGGPHLFRDLLDQGVVDEIDATVVPRLIGGTHPRITNGPPVDVPLRLHALLEEGGTLLGRWLV